MRDNWELVKRPARCRECGRALKIGEYAFWDPISQIYDGCSSCMKEEEPKL